jgi:hypothetical protein
MKLLLAFLLTLFVYTQAQEEAIRAAMRAQLEAPLLRSQVTTDSDGTVSETTIDYVAPDRFRLKDATTDMIIVGDKTYQNDGNGWEVLEMNMAAIITRYRNSEMIDTITFSNVQALGDETLDGKDCAVYSYTQDFEGLVSEDKLWIEKSTGLPIRLEGSGDFLGSPSTSVILYSYADVEISAPIQ